MRKETCGWMSVFCILSLWMGGIVYFVIDVRHELSDTLRSIERLEGAGVAINNTLSDVSYKTDQVKSLIGQLRASMPPKTVVVNKDGCVQSECLARVLLLVWDLRRSFALGAMSSDAVRAVKPMLSELNDPDIDDSLQVLESFNHKKGYRELKAELKAVRNALRLTKNKGLLAHISKWISIENHNDPMWQDFADLEILVDSGAWETALELVSRSNLQHVPRVQSWMHDLEFVLGVESRLSLIHNKLIERVNRNPEGI